MLKKIVAFSLAFALILGVYTPQVNFAEEGFGKKDKIDEEVYNSKKEVQLAKKLQKMSEKEIKKDQKFFLNQINKLTDPEFDRFMYNFVKDNYQSVQEMTENLKLLDVEFSMIEEKDKNKVSIASLTSTSDMDLTIYASKRGGQAWYNLQSIWLTGSEESPGTYDVVSVEWDPTFSEFYDAAVGTGVSKKDGSKRLSGSYLFNVEDDDDFDSYAVVRVIPKKSSGRFHYGTKYSHTYATVETAVTGTATISWSATGPTGGASYGVTLSQGNAAWDLWDDNWTNF
ncbi:hypothetical protein VQL36_19390 [Chengkuizengella sp. SCS-71B]|uniref:hypothetical protein n=1 Tax=Chengkuizengella sp. SCS-71B TaxID=3115290 RepID=UPI0032C24A11